MKTPLRRLLLSTAAAVSLVPLAHCGSSTTADDAVTTSEQIGPAGGALASYDYVIEILVPPGALTTTQTFTITPVDTPDPAMALAPAYTITPAGLGFAIPAVISVAQGAVALGAPNDPTDLRVASYVSSTWTPLTNASFDALAGTVEGTTEMLSAAPYSVVIPTATNCVSITAANGTCEAAYPGKCSAYPGAIVGGCTATTTSATSSCCVPTGQPICFAQTEPNGCGSPCAQFPGLTVQSCIPDQGPPFGAGTAGGLPQSVCCFASGAAVCTAVPAGGCASGTTASADGTSCCYAAGTIPSSLPDGGTASDGGVTSADAGDGVDAGADTGSADDSGANAD